MAAVENLRNRRPGDAGGEGGDRPGAHDGAAQQGRPAQDAPAPVPAPAPARAVAMRDIQNYVAGANTWTLYFIQGCVLALIDETLAALVGQVDLKYQQAVLLCKLPFSLKWIAAPLVDATRHRGGGLRTWLIAAQTIATVAIAWLSYTLQQTLDMLRGGSGDEASGEPSMPGIGFKVGLLVPLMILACATAVADVGVDTFALENCPRYRGLLQVTGVLIGRVFANPVVFYFGLEHSLIVILGPMMLASLLLVISIFALVREARVPPPAAGGRGIFAETAAVLQQVVRFCLRRPLMFWWMLHQLVPPATYFHLEVVRTRFAKAGLSLQNVAATDLLLFLPCAGGIALVDRLANGRLQSFIKAYFVQAAASFAIVGLYVGFANDWLPWGADTTAVVYGCFQRAQDVLFYVFEVGEFNHYGDIAALHPAISSTLLAMQASVFNCAEFLWPSLTANVVDTLSSPGWDAYPAVAVVSTLAGIGFFIAFWSRVAEYADVRHRGWEERPANVRGNTVLLVCLGVIFAYAIVSGVAASFTSTTLTASD